MCKATKINHRRRTSLLLNAAIEGLEKRLLYTVAFNPLVTALAGAAPEMVITADLTGNGTPDLITADSGGGVSVALGNGDGTFGPGNVLLSGDTVGPIATGDFDNNGMQDIVVADLSTDTIEIVPNEGDATFGTPVVYSAGTSFGGVAVADVNGDGYPDILVTNPNSGTVSVLLNNKAGGFESAITSPTSNTPMAIAVGDFENNGILGIVTVNGAGNNVTVQDGNGAGQFGTPTQLATGTQPVDVITGNFTGNNDVDIATANEGSDSVSVLLGNGNGTFQTAVNTNIGTEPVALAAADLNGDGQLDIVTAVPQDNCVAILLGNGNGTFAAPAEWAAGSGAESVALADFNGDGLIDVAAAGQIGDGVFILTQRQLAATDVTLSAQPTTLIAGDPLELSATVQGTILRTATPTGLVTFMDGAQPLGEVSLDATGTATLETYPLQPGNHPITAVYNGDSTFNSATSAPLNITVADQPPAPSIEYMTPEAATAGMGPEGVSVIGNSFTATSVVYVNGVAQSTTNVSNTQLNFTLSAADLAAPGTLMISVEDPETGDSNDFPFTVTAPTAITIDSMTPGAATAGAGPEGAGVLGNGFTASSVVYVNGVPQNTTPVSGTQLNFTLSAADLATPGSLVISVEDPDVGVSNDFTFTVIDPIATIDSMTPEAATAGAGPEGVSVLGNGFTATSVVYVNGVARDTTPVNETQVNFTLSAADLATPGTLIISVDNPEASASNDFPFTVTDPTAITIDSISTPAAEVGSSAETVTVIGSGFPSNSGIVANGTARSTTVVSSTELTFVLTAADLATAGPLPISVVGPGVGVSNIYYFDVTVPSVTVTAKPIKSKAATTFSGTIATFVDNTASTATSSRSIASTSQYAATIAWGDGTTSVGIIKSTANGFAVSGTHLYTTAGAYAYTVIITSVDGNQTNATTNETTATGDQTTATGSDSASTTAPISTAATGIATIGQASGASQRYAGMIYQVLLGRLITAKELKSAVKELGQGLSRLDLVLRIESTQEFRDAELHTIFHQV